MTRADVPTERFLAPAAGIGRRSWQGDSKTSGSADAGAATAFPELLSRLAEAGSARAATPLQPGVQEGMGEAMRFLDGDRMPETATSLPANGEAVTPAPATPDLLSSASMLAALVAAALPAPSGTSDGVTPTRGLTGIADQLDDAPLALGPLGSAGELPELGADKDLAGPLPKVTVLRQETHLAPTSARLPVEQATERLVAALAPSRPDGKAAPAAEDRAVLPTAAAPGEAADGDLPGPRVAPPSRGNDPGSASAHRSFDSRAEASASSDDGFVADQFFSDAKDDISAVHKEPNSAPSQGPLSPVSQIADRIARESLPQAGNPSVPTAAAKPAPATAIKMLHIELQPADLGTVTVRMTLKDGALELQLDAGREETARLLQQDRETLSSILRSAGYQIDAMTVRVAEPDRVSPTAAGSPTLSDPTPSQSGSAHPDARSSGGQARAERDIDSHRATRTSHHDESGAANRLGGDLYV